MNGTFNPAALHALEASFDDPLEVIQADELDLLRIGAEEVRTQCATFRLAETIVGVAMATRGQADDEAMLHVLKSVMGRVAMLRSAMLTALGIDQADAEFPAVFNAATKSAMCLVRAECLDYALATEERFGIWGGLSARDRHALTRIDQRGGPSAPPDRIHSTAS